MQANLTQPFMEGDYIKTREGLFFTIKGCVHPPDRVLACLRYAPDPQGDRQNPEGRYRRLYAFAEQKTVLETSYPHYLAFEPTIQAVIQSVPRQSIQRVFDPRARLEEIFAETGLDAVEKDAKDFSLALQRETGVSRDNFGLSGSVLIGLHTLQSDLDLAVYGEENCRAVQRTLDSPIFRDRDASIHCEIGQISHGFFQNRPFFIRYLKNPVEVGEKYGDRWYFPLGPTRIQATIVDDRQAIFTPCRYPICDVHFFRGSPVADLKEIVSYRGKFCERARTGDRIQAVGALECVQEKSGGSWCQLLLGNSEDDDIAVRR